MNEPAPRSPPNAARSSRWLGALTGSGTVAVALIMLLSPIAAAGVAHPAAGKGVVWDPSSSINYNGCAKARSAEPRFAPATGIGHWLGSVSATTCSKTIGGTSSSSSGDVSGDLEVEAPLHLTAASASVNVTWSLGLTWAIHAAVASTASCPGAASSYSYYDSYISSWVNTTSFSSYCSADASVNMYGDAYVEDTTSGATYYPSNYWYGVNANFDRYNDSSDSTTNYSNPAQWFNNYTSSNSYGYAHGSSGSGNFTAANSPSWFINATFVKGDKYMLVTYLDASASASINGLKSSSTSASLDAASGTNHEDLVYVVY
jgi:hypothetical protein